MKNNVRLKKHIDKILIILSFILLYFFIFYTEINNIATGNTWAGHIGIAIFGGPLLSGLWLLRNNIKNKNQVASRIIKIFVIFFTLVFVINFAIFLIAKIIGVTL